ncbi:16S rRNA (cytosine(1402)-N(4))-methyltransferase RsmH [Saezia sanguinis]|uniref:16S rRNA (cytosine(1402)-N(4))-methyltransferase RsmH n=1 Tax=Saezia sanguinis TaxID=1965230 RepID=UPI003040DB69
MLTQQSLEHQTVMLQEAVDAVVTHPDGFYVDGTFGRGGHTRELLSRLGPQGRLLALDRDPQAELAAAQIDDARLTFQRTEFAQIGQWVAPQSVDGLLLDVGVSSPQIDDPARGFSFRFDGPLDMRMDPEHGQSAADFLERADQQRIAEVIRHYGEERFAVSIAKAIVARRESGEPVRTTGELSRLVAAAVKTREPGQDPATRTFQALRIQVNEELAQLESALNAALSVLKPHGRIVVISFHSLEDRIVKQFMAKHSRQEPDRRAPFAQPPEPLLKTLGRFRPSEQEVQQNPRARSAIMRVAQRTEALALAESGSHPRQGRRRA